MCQGHILLWVAFLTQQLSFTTILGPGRPWAGDVSDVAETQPVDPLVSWKSGPGPLPDRAGARASSLALECW
jgi:hypothetical protein